MKIYSVSGYSFEEVLNGSGSAYFATKAEAISAAREATRFDAGEDTEDYSGRVLVREATVTVCHIDRVDLSRVVALLNAEGWCDRSEPVAIVRNGRVARNEPVEA